MTKSGHSSPVLAAHPLAEGGQDAAAAREFLALLSARRTIRRLRDGPLTEEMLARILEAARLTPAAYNRPPWRVFVLRERRADFWALVERAFRDRLSPDRLDRNLARLDGFRAGVAALLVYEDTAAQGQGAAWQLDAAQERAFAEQALGMVQLALWLALTAEGLVTSLQHWEALIEDRLVPFLGLPEGRLRLVAALPVGYADETPPPAGRGGRDGLVSRERYEGGDVLAIHG